LKTFIKVEQRFMVSVGNDYMNTTTRRSEARFRETLLISPRKNDLVVSPEAVVVMFNRVWWIRENNIV